MNETYLDKAVRNYNIAQDVYSNFACDDEMYLGYVGYHLQQSAELTMKYLLDKEGIDYPRTHDLNQFMIIAERENVNLYTTEYIYQNAALLTNWESNTRYVLNYMLERNRVEDALRGVREYILNVAELERNPEEEKHGYCESMEEYEEETDGKDNNTWNESEEYEKETQEEYDDLEL